MHNHFASNGSIHPHTNASPASSSSRHLGEGESKYEEMAALNNSIISGSNNRGVVLDDDFEYDPAAFEDHPSSSSSSYTAANGYDFQREGEDRWAVCVMLSLFVWCVWTGNCF